METKYIDMRTGHNPRQIIVFSMSFTEYIPSLATGHRFLNCLKIYLSFAFPFPSRCTSIIINSKLIRREHFTDWIKLSFNLVFNPRFNQLLREYLSPKKEFVIIL